MPPLQFLAVFLILLSFAADALGHPFVAVIGFVLATAAMIWDTIREARRHRQWLNKPSVLSEQPLEDAPCGCVGHSPSPAAIRHHRQMQEHAQAHIHSQGL